MEASIDDDQVVAPISPRNTLGSTTTTPPGRAAPGASGHQSWCMANAAHALATVGGVRNRSVADHDGGVGVAAAHGGAVAAEHHDLEVLLDRGLGQRAGRQLDALATDTREQERSFGHLGLLPRSGVPAHFRNVVP